ncbi:hypothetical protein [Bacillus thuringiensis]|uniref:Uncharacterized protein n=1 Tax=Bacillus thuringiensis TaxID=1428 RepID=A0A9X6WF75_BACTU|nr:hypothetical protein [Bacillus thuringiensis]PFJ24812.1 hypothetical protein COJ15_36230 [Bacillus thuringiensis]
MYHLIVLILCIGMTIINYCYPIVSDNANPIFSDNVRISIIIVGIIAYLRYMYEKNVQKANLLLERAKDLENKEKAEATVGVGTCICVFQEGYQMIPGFYDFLIKFEDDSELILSSSKAEVTNKIITAKGKMLFYYVDRFIVDVEEIPTEISSEDK